jgi:hypothetical protein
MSSLAPNRSLSPNTFIPKFNGLEVPLTESERAFVDHWSPKFPRERWGDFMHSWLVSLRAFGTPAHFTDGTTFVAGEFFREGRKFLHGARNGGNSHLRRELIAKQRPYDQLTSPGYPSRHDCVMCQNVSQARDATRYPDFVPNSAMAQIGRHILQPNRYPFPLQSLLIPLAHDDTRDRAPLIVQKEGGPRGKGNFCEPLRGRTRGALVDAAELQEQFEIVTALECISVTNHVLSGMSIPKHRHSHVIPRLCYVPGLFEKLTATTEQIRSSPHTSVGRSIGSPYEILVVSGDSLEALADEAASILNQLEMSDEVFAYVFIPSTDPSKGAGHVLISPVKGEEVANYFIMVGGTIVIHEFPVPFIGSPEAALYDRAVPSYGGYDWRTVGVALPTIPPATGESFTKEEIYRTYKPLEYPYTRAEYTQWGDGAHVRGHISPEALQIFEDLRIKGCQDLRGDPGHAEVVTFFAEKIARMMCLGPEYQEANVRAAIVHDAGWGVEPNINERWSALVTMKNHGSPEESRAAQAEMDRLRFGHEKRAAEIAREHCGNHPLCSVIAQTVLDHDTRSKPPIPEMRPFLDGDWLWRVTVMSRMAQSSGAYDRYNPDVVYKVLQGEFTPDSFTIPWVYHIARLEAANTILAMNSYFQWESLPKGFIDGYQEELKALGFFDA